MGLLLPLGAAAQAPMMVPTSLAVGLVRLIKGTSIAGAREQEIRDVLLLGCAAANPPAADQVAAAKALTQIKRGTIALSQRLDAHPDSADLHRRRGILYAQLSDPRAATDLARADELGVAPPEYDTLLARTYFGLGAYSKAQASADAHLRRHPGDARMYEIKALAELRRTKGDHAEHCQSALPDLNRALALDSASIDGRLMRAYALATTGQSAAAIADYRRALLQLPAPQNSWVHFFLAEALLSAGNTTEACAQFALAGPFAPKTTKAYQKKYCR